jgi:hypothetical protein
MHDSLQSREQLAAKDPDNSGARAEVAEACATLGDAYLLLHQPQRARDYYERAQAMYSELRSQGKLSADFRDEPDRLAAALAKIGSKGVS